MEKNKFEFQKLELPRQVLIKETVQEIPVNPINNEHSIQQRQKNIKNIGYYALTALIFTAAGYQLHQYFSSEENKKTIVKPENYISHNVAIQPKKDTIKAISKPIYINFYDSIVFLNKVKGQKKVISKGFDEYLKKNKLIVKVEDNYYNLYCEDLIRNYSVGDSIP